MESYTIKEESGKLVVQSKSGARVAWIADGDIVFDKLADTAEMLGQVDHQSEMESLGLDVATLLAIKEAGDRYVA